MRWRRALARLGEPTHARAALETAEDQLGDSLSVTKPEWVAPFDQAALASESALTLLDLHLLPQAAEAAERALALRNPSRARSRAFSQVTLARVLVAQGQVEQACAVGDDLLGSCQSLGSHRVSRQLMELELALAPYGGNRLVREFLDRMAVVSRHRKLLLAGLTLTEDS